MIRYSKRQNLVVFGIAESSAYATPEALAAHVQSLLFGHVPSSAAPLVSCTYRLGKWKVAQKKLRAVLDELTTVCSLSTGLLRPPVASEPSASAWMRISLNSRCNSARASPQTSWASRSEASSLFFRDTTLKYRDGGAVRQFVKGGANKVRAPAPTIPHPCPAHRLNIPMWQWILLRSCSKLVCQS